MRLAPLGGRTLVLSTGMNPKTTGSWKPLGAAYKNFTLQCERATSIATSAFTVKLFGGLTSGTTAPLTLITCTSATRIKNSTGSIAVSWIKFNSTKFSTAANRKLKIVMLASG